MTTLRDARRPVTELVGSVHGKTSVGHAIAHSQSLPAAVNVLPLLLAPVALLLAQHVALAC